MQAINYQRRAESKLMHSLGIRTKKSFRRLKIRMRHAGKWPYSYNRELRRMINTTTGDRL